MEKTLKFVRNFMELEVYKQAKCFSNKIFNLTTNFPKEPRYALTDLIRGFSKSARARIAEYWSKQKWLNTLLVAFTVHNSPEAIYHSLFTVHCLPFTVHRLPFTVYRSPFTVHRLPFTVYRS